MYLSVLIQDSLRCDPRAIQRPPRPGGGGGGGGARRQAAAAAAGTGLGTFISRDHYMPQVRPTWGITGAAAAPHVGITVMPPPRPVRPLPPPVPGHVYIAHDAVHFWILPQLPESRKRRGFWILDDTIPCAGLGPSERVRARAAERSVCILSTQDARAGAEAIRRGRLVGPD